MFYLVPEDQKDEENRIHMIKESELEVNPTNIDADAKRAQAPSDLLGVRIRILWERPIEAAPALDAFLGSCGACRKCG